MTDSITDPTDGLITTKWNYKQILGLAPDVMAVRATNRMIEPHRWEQLGQNKTYIWGEFKRANNTPHQIAVKLSDLSTSCPCISVKHPCKFVIGLMGLFANQPELFATEQTPPSWVKEQRAVAHQKEKQIDRTHALHEVQAGMSEFSRWLRDQVRQGLAGFEGQKSAGLESMANRLIDGHTPRIAEGLRDLAQVVAPKKGAAPENWPEILLKGYGKFYVFTQAWERFENLSEDEQADLIQACVSPAVRNCWGDWLAKEPVRDQWHVVGRRFEVVGRVWNRRTWMIGASSGRFAMTEELTTGRHLIVPNLATGSSITGTFTFEPGTLGAVGKLTEIECLQNHSIQNKGKQASRFEDLEQAYVMMLAQNPWLPAWPVLLNQMRLQYDQVRECWLMVDGNQRGLPITNSKESGWHLLASGGGRPLDLMAEWSADGLRLLSACGEKGWVDGSVWGGRI